MSKFFTLVAIIGLLLPGKLVTAQNIFVKILDKSGTLIAGESTDARHPNEIDATSFGQENTSCATNIGAGGGVCSGKPGHFIFNMNLNKSLPPLNKALFTGAALTSVDIVFRRAGGLQMEYYKLRLESVFVTHVTNSNDGTSTPTGVQVELDAARMGWTYIPQNPDGTSGTPLKFGWDITKNLEWTGF